MAAISTLLLLLVVAGSQTIMATENWEVNVSAKINGATADQVWPFVEDFCNLYKIYPSSISFCEKGTGSRPGLARYSVTIGQSPSNATTVVGWVREVLLEMNAPRKSVRYEIRENTFGIGTLKAFMQVVPAGNNDCTFNWNIVASPIDGLTYEGFATSFQVQLEGIVSMIENLF